jgi:hypothetical protein
MRISLFSNRMEFDFQDGIAYVLFSHIVICSYT